MMVVYAKSSQYLKPDYTSILQQSKLVHSRNDWKDKAVQRAYEIRDLKKTERRLKRQIQALKIQSCVKNESQKNNSIRSTCR